MRELAVREWTYPRQDAIHIADGVRKDCCHKYPDDGLQRTALIEQSERQNINHDRGNLKHDYQCCLLKRFTESTRREKYGST